MGLGCHVLIEQGDDQNHPAMIGVDVEMAGLPEMMSPYKKAFGECLLTLVAIYSKHALAKYYCGYVKQSCTKQYKVPFSHLSF